MIDFWLKWNKKWIKLGSWGALGSCKKDGPFKNSSLKNIILCFPWITMFHYNYVIEDLQIIKDIPSSLQKDILKLCKYNKN